MKGPMIILMVMIVSVGNPGIQGVQAQVSSIYIDSAYVEDVRQEIERRNDFDDKYYGYGDEERRYFLDSVVIEDTKTIQEDPDNIDAYLERGFANYKLRRYKDAIPDFSVYLKKEPSDFLAVYTLFRQAECFAMLRNYTAAVKSFNAAFTAKTRLLKDKP